MMPKNEPEQVLFPDLDESFCALLTDKNAQFVSEKLAIDGCCGMAFSVGGSTMYNIMFVDMNVARSTPLKDTEGVVHLFGKLNWFYGNGRLFIAIERVGAFVFDQIHLIYPSYLDEKFQHSFGTEVGENLCSFFKKIILQ